MSPEELKKLIEEEIKQYQQSIASQRGNKAALLEQLDNIEAQVRNIDVQINALNGAIEGLRVLLNKIEPKVVDMQKATKGKIDDKELEKEALS